MAALNVTNVTNGVPTDTVIYSVIGNVNVSLLDHHDYNVTADTGEDPYIPLYVYIYVSVCNVLLFLLGTFGNGMIVIVIITVRDMRTPTNYFLLSLSFADMLVLLICQPAALMEFYAKDRWFIGAVMCKVVPLMENGALHVSILTIMAVTAERYYAICHPFKTHLTCTVSTALKLIVAIWIVAYILAIPFLLMTDIENANFYDGSSIEVCRTRIDETWRYCYAVCVFVLFFALPFCILVFVYSRIIKQLVSDTLRTLARNDPSAVFSLRSRKQVVKMLIFIIVLFFVSLFPIRVVTLWLIFTPAAQVVQFGLEGYLNLISCARILMYVNSAGNPIIYSMTSTRFRHAFQGVLRRYRRWQRPGYTFSSRPSFPRKTQPDVPDTGHRAPSRSCSCSNQHAPYLVVKLTFNAPPITSHDDGRGGGQEAYPLNIICTCTNSGERATA